MPARRPLVSWLQRFRQSVLTSLPQPGGHGELIPEPGRVVADVIGSRLARGLAPTDVPVDALHPVIARDGDQIQHQGPKAQPSGKSGGLRPSVVTDVQALKALGVGSVHCRHPRLGGLGAQSAPGGAGQIQLKLKAGHLQPEALVVEVERSEASESLDRPQGRGSSGNSVSGQ